MDTNEIFEKFNLVVAQDQDTETKLSALIKLINEIEKLQHPLFLDNTIYPQKLDYRPTSTGFISLADIISSKVALFEGRILQDILSLLGSRLGERIIGVLVQRQGYEGIDPQSIKDILTNYPFLADLYLGLNNDEEIYFVDGKM